VHRREEKKMTRRRRRRHVCYEMRDSSLFVGHFIKYLTNR